MRKLIPVVLLSAFCAPVSAGDMQDANKAVARAFYEEVLDQGHLDRYASSHAADFIVHTGQGDLPLAADMAAAAEERKALPDLHVTVNRMIAEDDLVVIHWTATGTNTGDGMGFDAKGARIRIPGMTIFRFKAGKISEEWSVFDMLAAYRQAGLCPKP